MPADPVPAAAGGVASAEASPARPRGGELGLALVLLAACLGDLPWQEQLGTLTRSPMFAIAPPLALGAVLLRGHRLGALERGYGAYWAITTVVSLATLLVFLLGGEDLSAGGKNLLVRTFLAGAENLIHLFALVALIHLLRTMRRETVWRLALGFFASLCAIAAVEKIAPELLYPLHSDASAARTGVRLSLLTAEPSQAAPLLAGVYFLFVTLGLELRRRGWLLALGTALFLVVFRAIDSKGGIPILAVSVLVALAVALRSDRRLGLSLGLATLLAAAALVADLVTSPAADVGANLQAFTSVATRVTGVASSAIGLLEFPLGMGYGTYLVHYPPVLEETAEVVQRVFSVPVNMSEVLVMAGTGENLGAKAGLATQVIYNGALALAFFGWVFRRAWRRARSLPERSSVAFAVQAWLAFSAITFALAADSNTLYAYLLPLAVLEAWTGRRASTASTRST